MLCGPPPCLGTDQEAGFRVQEEKGLSEGPGAAGGPWPDGGVAVPRCGRSPACPRAEGALCPDRPARGPWARLPATRRARGSCVQPGAVEHPALTSPEIAVRGQGEGALTSSGQQAHPRNTPPRAAGDRASVHTAAPFPGPLDRATEGQRTPAPGPRGPGWGPRAAAGAPPWRGPVAGGLQAFTVRRGPEEDGAQRDSAGGRCRPGPGPPPSVGLHGDPDPGPPSPINTFALQGRLGVGFQWLAPAPRGIPAPHLSWGHQARDG